jgi:hypothetical protein
VDVAPTGDGGVERMIRVPRAAIALLVLAALSASLASAGLVHAVAHSDDESYCCCPNPDECRCTANCCNHGSATQRSAGTADGPAVRSSVSCRFPVLPDGSLSRAAGPDATPFTVADGEDHPVQIDRPARLIEFGSARQFESLHSAVSPRAPPGATRQRC